MTRTGSQAADWKVLPLAGASAAVLSSAEHDKVHLANPSMVVFPNGRIVLSVDQVGPGVRHLPGAKGRLHHFAFWVQGKLLISRDKGETWTVKQDFPFCGGRLFRDGQALYLLGHRGNLLMMKSADGGETWSRPSELTSKDDTGGRFTLAPSRIVAANGSLYVVMMRIADFSQKGRPASALGAVVLRAPEGAALLDRKSWTLSEPSPAFRELVPEAGLDHSGIPFYEVPDSGPGQAVGRGRWATRLGWGEPCLVRLVDPNHSWHDPSGCTLHMLARGETHRSNVAVLAKVQDRAGTMRVSFEAVPSGRKQLFLPVPGGNSPFDLLFDDESGLFWLLSNQMRDSMTRADVLPHDRFGLPCDEAHCLQLHFSRNLVDWCFAGLVDAGTQSNDLRLDPCMAIHGQDLYVAYAAGDVDTRAMQDTDRLVSCVIPSFRELVY